jgi:hypothetical protein
VQHRGRTSSHHAPFRQEVAGASKVKLKGRTCSAKPSTHNLGRISKMVTEQLEVSKKERTMEPKRNNLAN